MITEFKILQDHLGDIQDNVVAIDLLGSYLQTGDWDISERLQYSGEKKIPDFLKGVETYKTYREEELHTLLDTFLEAWTKIQSEEFRQKIESSIKNLYKESIFL